MRTLFDWSGLSSDPGPLIGDTGEAYDSPQAALARHLGAVLDAHFRMIAMPTPDEFSAMIAALNVSGALATHAVVMQARLAHATARRLCHLDPWPSVVATVLPAPPTPLLASPSATLSSKVKVATVLNQTCEDEIVFIPTDEVLRMNSRYITVMGCDPPEEMDTSDEQLAAVAALADPTSSKIPYADFGIWGPHGTRILRRTKLGGLRMDRDGSFRTAELYGPESLAVWQGCWAVWETACIKTGLLSRPVLAEYARHIAYLATRFGPTVWHIIYQADVRCRSELIGRKRIEAIGEHEKLVSKGHASLSTFDSAHPWNAAFAMCIGDHKWWRKEAEDPAFMVLAKLQPVADFVDGDAAVASHSAPSAPTSHRPPLQATLQATLARTRNPSSSLYWIRRAARHTTVRARGFARSTRPETVGLRR